MLIPPSKPKNSYRRTIYVNADGIVWDFKFGKRDLSEIYPLKDGIKRLNKLVDEGDYLVYWSDIGKGSSINYIPIISDLMDEWGCKYHKLNLDTNPPQFDVFVCKKAVNSLDFLNQIEIRSIL